MKITSVQDSPLQAIYLNLSRYDGANATLILAEIKRTEDFILSSVSESDADLLLMAASVGRYSLAYWDMSMGSRSTKTLAPFWKKFTVALCDVIGGAVAGASTSLTGPGAVGAVIVGAVSTSASAA